jgi:hypothetical protein
MSMHIVREQLIHQTFNLWSFLTPLNSAPLSLFSPAFPRYHDYLPFEVGRDKFCCGVQGTPVRPSHIRDIQGHTGIAA